MSGNSDCMTRTSNWFRGPPEERKNKVLHILKNHLKMISEPLNNTHFVKKSLFRICKVGLRQLEMWSARGNTSWSNVELTPKDLLRKSNNHKYSTKEKQPKYSLAHDGITEECTSIARCRTASQTLVPKLQPRKNRPLYQTGDTLLNVA